MKSKFSYELVRRVLPLLIFKESPIDVRNYLLMYRNTFCFWFTRVPTYQYDSLLNSPKSIELKSYSLIDLEFVSGDLRNSWSTLYSLFYNVILFGTNNLIYHRKALVFKLININPNNLAFDFSNLRILSKHLNTQDVVDHLHLSDMPVKVVLNHSLLSFNKPFTLPEIVISHIFA